MIAIAVFLRRYHDALAGAREPEELARIARRFRTNHRVGDDDPCLPAMEKIYYAHAVRVAGRSSPAEADAAARAVYSEAVGERAA